jgi:hypothetical protein
MVGSERPWYKEWRPVRLPNADAAKVAPEKLEEYILSATHPVGKLKARFFRTLGFDSSDASELARLLLQIARNEEVQTTVYSAHGTKFVIDGMLPSRSGGPVRVRTVWILETGQQLPRFVTAYPV